MIPGSFDEAANGCEVVFHTASPFIQVVKNPKKDLIEPAVFGTENILSTVNRTRSVKQVILTSSIGAIFTEASETSSDHPASEEDWNTSASQKHMPYFRSKTLAEKKAWEIARNHRSHPWKLTTILPGLVIGPGLKYHETSESYRIVRSLGSYDLNMVFGAVRLNLGVVDVRDVAAARVAAAFSSSQKGGERRSVKKGKKNVVVTVEEKKNDDDDEDEEDDDYDDYDGGRYFIVRESISFSGMGELIARKYGSKYPIVTKSMPRIFKPIVWMVAPYTGQMVNRKFINRSYDYPLHVDNSKSKKELGMDYLPLESGLQDMYQQMIDCNDVPTRVLRRKVRSFH